MKILEINEIDSTELNAFVYNHMRGNVFQAVQYYTLHCNIKNYAPFGYVLLKDNKIVASVIGVINSNYYWPAKALTKRAIIIGGPLIENDDKSILAFFLNKLSKALRNKSIYIEIRNIWNTVKYKDIFETFGFNYVEHLDIIHDLTAGKKDILQNISKNKRGNVRKSTNKGTIFTEITELDLFTKSIELIQQTYKTIGLPCPPEKYFISAFKIYSPLGVLKTFVALDGDTIMGVRLVLCYKDMVYDWYAGSDKKYSNRYPNDFLPFHILFWSKENGYRTFDFGGAGKPGIAYGVRDHKMKFGGKLVSYGRYEKINKPILMFIAQKAFIIYNYIKAKKHK